MTWTAQPLTPVNVLVYRLDDKTVHLGIGPVYVRLDPEQRRGLAEYLLKELPE